MFTGTSVKWFKEVVPWLIKLLEIVLCDRVDNCIRLIDIIKKSECGDKYWKWSKINSMMFGPNLGLAIR